MFFLNHEANMSRFFFIFIAIKMSHKPKKTLTLEQNVEALKLYDRLSSSTKFADEFGVRKDQIQRLIKRKAEVLEDYENNVSMDRKGKGENLIMKTKMTSSGSGSKI